ncbi:response regulator [uncultured Polaribacter sp.]|uniref:response regulator n=1 Tax=uncultured Polaribacter sp. TaxID=174711 RepID=UPI00262FBFF0|nr:response regulator [uncultured Polaribacter sp.]
MIYSTSIICFIGTFLSFIIATAIGSSILNKFLLLFSIIFLISSILTKKGFPKTSRIILIIFFNLLFTFLSFYIGKPASIEFFLIFAVGLPFSFYSYIREKPYIIFFCAFSFLCWLLLYLTNFQFNLDIKLISPTKTRNIIYHISITITLLLVVFKLIFYSYTNAIINSFAHATKKKAIEASNAKSNFLSTVSHEIRTPLNAVIGLSHILRDNNPRQDQIENIQALSYSGKILLNLLNNVLDFSKMQSTNIDLDSIPTNLPVAIKQIEKIHEASCLSKDIKMNLEIDNDIPIVWLDIVRFNQVINNLISNSIKFTKKGSVTLRVKKVNQTTETVDLLTEVIDTGVGIPIEKQEIIWEAFTQASSETNRLYGGTGLGLPIVKNIVKAMGSNIKIDSEIGKGCRFYFQLTLKLSSNKELLKTNQKKEFNFKGKSVLLIEDNQINVMVGKQILEKVNFKVEVANNGLEAIDMVKEKHFDILLMDIQMPIMDGYTASKEIRKFNKYIPILALSASVFVDVKDKMEESGMNGFIFKPFDPEDLMNQIELALKDKLKP